MKNGAALGEVRLPSVKGLPATTPQPRSRPGKRWRQKPSHRGGKGIPIVGTGLRCDGDTRPQRLGRDRWHLVMGGLKSIFSSQKPKPLPAAVEWGSQHPYGPVRGNKGTPAQRRGLGQGVWGSLSLTPSSNPTLGFCMCQSNPPVKMSMGVALALPNLPTPPSPSPPAAKARPQAARQSPARPCVGKG